MSYQKLTKTKADAILYCESFDEAYYKIGHRFKKSNMAPCTLTDLYKKHANIILADRGSINNIPLTHLFYSAPQA